MKKPFKTPKSLYPRFDRPFAFVQLPAFLHFDASSADSDCATALHASLSTVDPIDEPSDREDDVQ
jgi:hypothetical protein